MKVGEKLTKIIIVCGIVFFTILSVCTAFFTVAQSDGYEGAYKISFVPAIIIGVIIVAIFFSLKLVRKILLKINIKTFFIFIFIWGLVVSLLWIFIANVLPMWDSMDLISAANLLNGTPDTTSGAQWAEGWYMERFPYQTPMVLFIVFCMKIAGSNFVVFFEVINCFACAFTMYYIVKLAHELFHKKLVTVVSGILVMFFIPVVLYCTFIYGNIICIPFCLVGFLLQNRAINVIDDDRRRFILNALVSALCFALSVFLKSSMSIVMIASMVVWVVWAIGQKRLKVLVFAILPFVLLKGFSFVVNSSVSSITGTNLSNGVPKIAWIGMGIGAGNEYRSEEELNPEIKNSLENPGYFDAFVWVTDAEEYSPDLVSDISKEYIKKRIKHFISDPIFAIRFFGEKFLIEWAEPTFEGFLASNWHVTSASTGYNMSKRDYTAIAPSIYYGAIHFILCIIMDVMQTVLALGSLIALVVYRKRLRIMQLSLIIVVMGGALLYLLWENKTQYIFPFYLFMIPIASLGFVYLSTKIVPEILSKIKDKLHQ